MPAKLDRCVEKVMNQGRSKSSAFAICNASLYKKAISDNYIAEKGGLSKIKKDLFFTEGLDNYARDKVAGNIEVPKERINNPTHNDIKFSMTGHEYENYKKQVKRRDSAYAKKSRIRSLQAKNYSMKNRLAEYGTRKNISAMDKFKIKAGKALGSIKKGLSGAIKPSPKPQLVPALAKVLR